MVLLKLMIDLKKLHQWKLHVWHGDHGWHNQSRNIAEELKVWCKHEDLDFFSHRATKKQVKNEESARDWRYEYLYVTAKMLSKNNQSCPCKHVLTGHTGSDRAETLLLNLARGADLAGISSLNEVRELNSQIQLVRPLLCFSRKETEEICQQLHLPIWIDPSNTNTTISRNRVRNQIFPILEDLYPGCSMRMASLSERLQEYKEDQNAMAMLLLDTIEHPQGLCRKTLLKLPLTARATILASWLKKNRVPGLSANQLIELSHKIGKNKPPGCSHLAKQWKIEWVRDSIQLIHPN